MYDVIQTLCRKNGIYTEIFTNGIGSAQLLLYCNLIVPVKQVVLPQILLGSLQCNAIDKGGLIC